MSMLFTRAPLRISLGGGGTDLPSYYSQHEGFLVSGAIDKYVYMLTHTAFQRRYRMKYAEFEEVDRPEDIRQGVRRHHHAPSGGRSDGLDKLVLIDRVRYDAGSSGPNDRCHELRGGVDADNEHVQVRHRGQQSPAQLG